MKLTRPRPFSVPAAAFNISANSSGTGARLSWQQPEGDLDALAVKVTSNGTDLWRATLPPDATEVTVDQLTPGWTYGVVVVTSSGKLSSQSESSFRTGEHLPLPSFRAAACSCVCVLQLQQRPRSSPSPPPPRPPVGSCCLGRPLLAAGSATGCCCWTAPSCWSTPVRAGRP